MKKDFDVLYILIKYFSLIDTINNRNDEVIHNNDVY